MPDIHDSPDRPVLVGVDGSVESVAALGLAAVEARLGGAPLVVTHAWAGPHWRPGRVRGERLTRSDAERLLASATAWLRVHHPDVPVTGRLVLGDAVQVLTAGSVAARLVVVGHRGNGLHLLGWGSVAVQLSRRTKAPLIVRRFRPAAAEPHAAAPVVVAVSPTSSGRTLSFAFEEAARYGVPLAACYVWSPGADGGGTRPSPRDYAQARAEAAGALEETLAGWSGRYPEVEVHPQVRHGVDVAQTLAAAARGARLLVVGAGPDNALVEMLCGSVSRGLLRAADCPVAVVPEPATQEQTTPDAAPVHRIQPPATLAHHTAHSTAAHPAAAPVVLAAHPAAAEASPPYLDVPHVAASHPAASEPVGAAGGRSGTG